MNLEDELRKALRREEAPSGFASRLLARARVPVWRRPAWLAMAAALAAGAFLPPAISEYQRREEARGLEARRELFVALSVTRTKLRQVRKTIQRNTRHTL